MKTFLNRQKSFHQGGIILQIYAKDPSTETMFKRILSYMNEEEQAMVAMIVIDQHKQIVGYKLPKKTQAGIENLNFALERLKDSFANESRTIGRVIMWNEKGEHITGAVGVSLYGIRDDERVNIIVKAGIVLL